ncbi:MAG: hypothetical protein GY749_08065 [Desulfobacteraceae bacterium]|nr:hypothetical protein [Desulfobacteraceae bacterium]
MKTVIFERETLVGTSLRRSLISLKKENMMKALFDGAECPKCKTGYLGGCLEFPRVYICPECDNKWTEEELINTPGIRIPVDLNDLLE